MKWSPIGPDALKSAFQERWEIDLLEAKPLPANEPITTFQGRWKGASVFIEVYHPDFDAEWVMASAEYESHLTQGADSVRIAGANELPFLHTPMGWIARENGLRPLFAGPSPMSGLDLLGALLSFQQKVRGKSNLSNGFEPPDCVHGWLQPDLLLVDDIGNLKVSGSNLSKLRRLCRSNSSAAFRLNDCAPPPLYRLTRSSFPDSPGVADDVWASFALALRCEGVISGQKKSIEFLDSASPIKDPGSALRRAVAAIRETVDRKADGIAIHRRALCDLLEKEIRGFEKEGPRSAEEVLDDIGSIVLPGAARPRARVKRDPESDLPASKNGHADKFEEALLLLDEETRRQLRLRCRPGVFAGPRTPILITGPRGCGKATLAKGIHTECLGQNISSFRFLPSHSSNGGAGDSVFKMLFGSADRPFSGELQERPGIFKLASTGIPGTVFLDDILSLSLEAQSRLLDILRPPHEFNLWDAVDLGPRTCQARVIAAAGSGLRETALMERLSEELLIRLRSYFVIEMKSIDEESKVKEAAFRRLWGWYRDIIAPELRDAIGEIDRHPRAFAALLQAPCPENYYTVKRYCNEAIYKLKDKIQEHGLGASLHVADIDPIIAATVKTQSFGNGSGSASPTSPATIRRLADYLALVAEKHRHNRSKAAKAIKITLSQMNKALLPFLKRLVSEKVRSLEGFNEEEWKRFERFILKK